MSYDDALDQMRGETPEPPSFPDVQRAGRWRTEHRLLRGRLALVLAATYLCALAFVVLSVLPVFNLAAVGAGKLAAFWRGGVATLLPALLLLWAGRLACRDGVGAAMLARAIWWSNLVVGVLIATAFIDDVQRSFGVFVAISCAVALLAAGRRGLDDDRPGDPFSPVRFRGQLLVALVMAFADAQTLAFSALIQLRIGMQGWNLAGTLSYAGPTIIAAAVMALSVWGLYRLRTWALILNLVANIAIAFFALEGSLGLSMPVAGALAATAAVQSLLPYAIFAAALGDRKAGKPVLGRLALPGVFVAVGMTALLAVAGRGGQGSGWMTGPGRAFERGLSSRPVIYRQDMRDADMAGKVLPLRAYAESDLRGADFSRSRAGGVSFTASDLRGASFRNAEYLNVAFDSVDLREADLSEAHMYQCRGLDIRADRAIFRGTLLMRCRLDFDSLAGADFRNADLSFSDISWPQDLAGARFEGATCPNLNPADPARGCLDETGRISAVDPEARRKYNGKLEQISAPSEVDRTCRRPYPVARVFTDGEYLLFLGRRFFRQSSTRFVRSGLSDDRESIEFSWDDEGRRSVRHEMPGCGDYVWQDAD